MDDPERWVRSQRPPEFGRCIAASISTQVRPKFRVVRRLDCIFALEPACAQTFLNSLSLRMILTLWYYTHTDQFRWRGQSRARLSWSREVCYDRLRLKTSLKSQEQLRKAQWSVVGGRWSIVDARSPSLYSTQFHSPGERCRIHCGTSPWIRVGWLTTAPTILVSSEPSSFLRPLLNKSTKKDNGCL